MTKIPLLLPGYLVAMAITAMAIFIAPVYAQSKVGEVAGYPRDYGIPYPSADSPDSYGNAGIRGGVGNHDNLDYYGVAPPPRVVPKRVYVQPLPSPLPGYRQREVRREWQDRDDRANYQRDRRHRQDDRETQQGFRRDERYRDGQNRDDGLPFNGDQGYPYGQRSGREVWRR